MANGRNRIILRHVRTLFDVGTVGGLTDGELLDRFEAGRGEVAELAFAVLVERHGPMVLRACRKLLRDEHAVEDAFQATFLVLARKGGSIRRRDTLGPWLHGVACRVAACARVSAARRKRHEEGAARQAAQSSADPMPDEAAAAIHEEIARLPERYRWPIVLCGLEGLTREQAALRLGWPFGTVQSRLDRGREQLRRRLIRRGLTPAVGTVASSLAAEAATGSVPARLTEAMVVMAQAYLAGRIATGIVPAGVGSLLTGVLKMMLVQKLKVIAVASAAVASIGIGVAWGQQSATPSPQPGLRSGGPVEDRFEQLERKMDRLIEVINGRAVVSDRSLIEAEVAVAEEKARAAGDQVSWTEALKAKNYASASQVKAAQLALKEAIVDLERVKARLRQADARARDEGPPSLPARPAHDQPAQKTVQRHEEAADSSAALKPPMPPSSAAIRSAVVSPVAPLAPGTTRTEAQPLGLVGPTPMPPSLPPGSRAPDVAESSRLDWLDRRLNALERRIEELERRTGTPGVPPLIR